MIYRNPQNPNSHLTVKERKYLSFPSRHLIENHLLKGKILDFGCGIGKDVAILNEKGLDVSGFDPYYFPEFPSRKFDTIICQYVLNVLLPDEQADVLMNVSYLLKPGGKAYFTVRRDIRQNGFLYNPKREAKTYQCNVTLPYKSIYRNENCEIYEYQHFTTMPLAITTDCQFCKPLPDTETFLESATTYVLKREISTNEIQFLIIPKRHVTDFFEQDFRVQTAFLLVLNKVNQVLRLEQAACNTKAVFINEKYGKEHVCWRITATIE